MSKSTSRRSKPVVPPKTFSWTKPVKPVPPPKEIIYDIALEQLTWPYRYNKNQRAYIIFYNPDFDYENFSVLTGLNYENIWSGIGGGRAREFSEYPFQTAIREMTEELFGWKYDNETTSFKIDDKFSINLYGELDYYKFQKLVLKCFNKLDKAFFIKTKTKKVSYVFYVVRLDGLKKLIQEVFKRFSHEIQSPFYMYRNRYTLPKNFNQFIDNRKHNLNEGEIQKLEEVDAMDIIERDTWRGRIIDKNFQKDLTFFQIVMQKLEKLILG